MEKTHVLFPSQVDSTLDLPSLLTHSKATNAYDAVWTIASAWNHLIDASLCDNDTTLVKGMEQALDDISVRPLLHTVMEYIPFNRIFVQIANVLPYTLISHGYDCICISKKTLQQVIYSTH